MSGGKSSTFHPSLLLSGNWLLSFQPFQWCQHRSSSGKAKGYLGCQRAGKTLIWPVSGCSGLQGWHTSWLNVLFGRVGELAPSISLHKFALGDHLRRPQCTWKLPLEGSCFAALCLSHRRHRWWEGSFWMHGCAVSVTFAFVAFQLHWTFPGHMSSRAAPGGCLSR